MLDELIARMAALGEPLGSAADNRRYFHATYQRTTIIAVAEEIKRADRAAAANRQLPHALGRRPRRGHPLTHGPIMIRKPF